MYLQPPALRALLDLHGEIQPLSLHLKQNRASPFPKPCPFPGTHHRMGSVGASKGEKLHCLWVSERSKGCSKQLFLEGQAVCESFACKDEAELFKPPGFLQSGFPCWFQPCPSEPFTGQENKKANKQLARSAPSQFLLSQSLCRQLLSRTSSN